MAIAPERTITAGEHSYRSAELLEKDISFLSRKKQLTPDDQDLLASNFQVIAMMMGRREFEAFCIGLQGILTREQQDRVLKILETDKEKVDGIHFKGTSGAGTEPPEYAFDLVRTAFAKPAVSGTMSQ